ncbi:phage tail protein [Neobacillus sp. M.A.Huq-85]
MATLAEMMIEIGVDTTDMDRSTQQAQNDMRGIGASVAELADNMDTSMADIRRQWRGMSEEMRQAHRQNAAALAPFRAQQQEIQYEFFQMAQGMEDYQGTTQEFMDQLTELGNRNRQVNDNMIRNNNMMRMGFIQGIATMLARSTASSKIAAKFDRMRNPLYRVNNGLLAVSGGIERIAARGQPAALALRMLGPNANMKALNDMTRMITAGIMRMNAVALVAAAGSAILYTGLAKAAYDSVPSFKNAADEMMSSVRKAFQPMVEAFAAVVTPIMKVITAIANLAIKFNEAHPFLAKLIQGFLMIIPLLMLILSPLAIGIGLFAGLQAAFASVWMLIGPLVTGLAAMSGTVLVVAGIIVALVAVGILLYKNWDTIKAKAIEIWGAIQTFFVNLWSGIVTVAVSIWSSITSFFSSLWNGIKSVFFTVINFIANFIQSKFGYILSAIRIVIVNVKNIIKNYWNIIKNIFLGVILIITDIITGDFGSIKGHVKQIMSNIKGSIQSIWNSIKSIFTVVVRTVVNFVKTSFSDMKNAAVRVFNGLKTGTVNAATSLKNSVVNGFKAMKTSVSNTMTNVKTSVVNGWNKAKSFLTNINLKQIGVNIIQGLVNGIKSMVGAVGKAISDVAGNIKSKIKGALGIKSPSRWMRDMIGKNIPLGMAVGIEAESGSVIDSLNALSDDVKYATPDVRPLADDVFALPGVKPIGPLSSHQQKTEKENGAEYIFHLSIPIDGREVAKATVVYNQEELDKRQVRKNRFGGLLDGI